MKYVNSRTSLDDVVRHLRNKNLAVFPAHRSFAIRALQKLATVSARHVDRALASAGYELVVSEQIVEMPMVLRHLEERHRTVLDFGGYESALPLQLSALGFHVTVLDQRPY